MIASLLYADENLEPTTLLVTRTAFDEVGLFRKDFPTAEDRQWLLRYLVHHEILVVDDCLVRFTQHVGTRLTRNHAAMAEGEAKFFEFVEATVDRLGGDRRRALAYRYAKWANETILAGSHMDGVRLFARAISYDPLSLRGLAGGFVSLFGPKLYRRVLALRMPRLRSQ